jgi:hypothetical protein
MAITFSKGCADGFVCSGSEATDSDYSVSDDP